MTAILSVEGVQDRLIDVAERVEPARLSGTEGGSESGVIPSVRIVANEMA